jgi:hypothetical protein
MFTSHESCPFPFTDQIQEHVRFLFAVNAEARQKIGYSAKVCAGFDKSKEQVPVHCELKRLINSAHRLAERPSPNEIDL